MWKAACDLLYSELNGSEYDKELPDTKLSSGGAFFGRIEELRFQKKKKKKKSD